MPKLMLVEDDNNLREIYEARLQAEGYDIVAAKDGEEALVVAKAEKPDLVISDVMMPKISGFEMLDILRNTDGLKDVKVIMLTALGQSDDQQRADKLGADRYLVKSQVTLEDIVKAAHELLGDGEAATSAEAAPAAATEPSEPSPAPTPAPVEAPTAPAEPVAVTPEPAPAPEPPASPAPEPAATPAPDPTPAPSTTDDTATQAQSTADEEAAVEAQIEEFVAGATDVPTTPNQAPAPVKTATASEVVEVTEPPVIVAPTEADNQQVTAAVDNLAAQTPPASAPLADEPAAQPDYSETASGAPASTPSEQNAALAPKPDVDTPKESKSIGGVKVINPLPPDSSKKDIDELLALETAKEQSSQASAPTAVVVTNEAGVQQPGGETKPAAAAPTPAPTAAPPSPAGPNSVPPATPGTTVDPNSIAL